MGVPLQHSGSEAFSSPEAGERILKDIKNGIRYNFDPLFDWRPFPNQKLKTIEIDKYGLRNTIGSGKGSYRILLLGGSFAWGYGASSNATMPASVIEALLRERGIDAEIINLADQNFNSIHEMRSFMFTVHDLKPDAVISITGHNDISAAYGGFYNYHRRNAQIFRFVNWGIMTGIITEKSWLRILLKIIASPLRPFTVKSIEERASFVEFDQDDVPLRLSRQKIDLISSYCIDHGIKAAFVLQPSLYVKKVITKDEAKHAEVYLKTRMAFYQKLYGVLINEIWRKESQSEETSDLIRYVDASTYFDDQEQTIFLDSGHTSDDGYRIFSEKLVNEVGHFF